MRKIEKVLCTAYISEDSQKKLQEAFAPAEVTFIPFVFKDKIREAVLKEQFDVCVANGDLDQSMLESKNLKWVHCCRAGVDKSAREDVFERGIILTSSSGRSSSAIAEHALMFMLSLTYDMGMFYRAQQNHQWAVSKEYYERTGMFKKTVAILGTGKNGQELARLVKPFGMNVLGYNRHGGTLDNFDEIVNDEQGLNRILAQADYVAVMLELNDSTYHLLNKEKLSLMKKDAFLINLGRGPIVDEKALIEMLKNKEIQGAGLDCFEQEPLNQDSELWDLENVMITPHMTPQLPDREERMLSYVYQNIEAYRNETEFVNRVSEKSIYRGKKQ